MIDRVEQLIDEVLVMDCQSGSVKALEKRAVPGRMDHIAIFLRLN